MPIQLDKILENIAREKALHPNNKEATKKEIEDAWSRVGQNNKLSIHESRSIFKVLQKKYEQEKLKGNSVWKLFGLMQEIHLVEPKAELKEEEEDQSQLEEVEEYEMLEVQEPEEDEEPSQENAKSTTGASDGDSSTKTHSSDSTPEKEERLNVRSVPRVLQEEKKVLNSMAHTQTPRSAVTTTPTELRGNSVATAAALKKKGITLKKAITTNVNKSSSNATSTSQKISPQQQRIQLPENLKRKLSEEVPQLGTKKIQLSSNATATSTATSVVHTTTSQLMQVKKDRGHTPPPGINVITIPANPARVELNNGQITGAAPSTATTVASTSTNGFSPRIEELDFKHDIIFDAGTGLNGNSANKVNTNNAPNDIINLGNFDNSLPPTFFKNLCNSSRHEALGLYVSNVMNRLSKRASSKLEISILRAILDVQSDELED